MTPVVLVTGANGFVGRNVVSALSESSFEVRAAVRHERPADDDVVVGDIGPDTFWKDALAGVSIIVHLAARVHVMNDTTTDPLAEFRKVNLFGTERLAIEATRAGVRRFIYVSSIKVNGESTAACSDSFSEKNAPNPQDPYGLSKWEAEQALHRIAQETGLEVVIIRPPLVYGPGVGANFLKLLRIVDKGIPLPFGKGENKRSFVYLGNLVDAIMTCLKHTAAKGQTYLVSDGVDISTPELIRCIAHALDRPVRILSFPPKLLHLVGKVVGKSEMTARLLDSLVIDSSKIHQELNWKPPYSMELGLQETAKWYRNQLNKQS